MVKRKGEKQWGGDRDFSWKTLCLCTHAEERAIQLEGHRNIQKKRCGCGSYYMRSVAVSEAVDRKFSLWATCLSGNAQSPSEPIWMGVGKIINIGIKDGCVHSIAD